MRFKKRNDRVSQEGTRPGFNDAHVAFLNRESHTPRTQIFSSEEIIEDPEKEEYFCAMCKSLLSYDKRLEAYHCSECVQWYDLRLQDKPLSSIEDFKLVPYAAQRHYPEFDSEDDHMPFVESVELMGIDKDMEGVDEFRSYEGGLIQRIKVQGSFADALAKSNILSAKKKEGELE